MNAPSSSAPRRGMPGWIWILVVPVALVLVAWLALVILFPPAKVRAIVQAQLAGALAREVRYDDAHIGLWPPVRLTVVGPALAEPGGFAQGAAFRARSVHFDLDVGALLGQRMVVKRLVLDGPQIHLVLRPDGTTNFDNLVKSQPAAQKAGKPMDLEVRELSIQDGRVLVDDLKDRRRIALGVGSTIALTSEAGGTRFATDGKTEITDFAFGADTARSLASLNTSLSKLTWKIEHRGKYDTTQEKLALERLAVQFDRTELALSGLVTHPGPQATLDLRARGSGIDFGQVMEFLSAADAKAVQGVKASGRMDLDLGVSGTMAPDRLPAVIGTMRVSNASMRYPGAPAGVENLAFTARFAPDSLMVGDLRARVTSGAAAQPVAAQLLVTRFADPMVRFALQGDVDLAAVAPLVAPKDTKLSGRVHANVRGSGRAKDPGSFALEGNATLRQVSVENPQLPKKVEGVDGAITFSPASATVKGLTAKAGASSFTLDASVTRPLALMAKPGSVAPSGVDFTFRSPHLDLAELLPTTPGAPVVPNASGGGRVAIDRLVQGKLDVRDVQAAVKLSPTVVEAPSFSCAAYGGRVTGNAKFDVADPQNPGYALVARMDSVQADGILSAWTPLKGLVQGSLNTTLDLSGKGITPEMVAHSLTAKGLAALANGTFGPTPALEALANVLKIPAARVTKIHDLHLPFQVDQGRVFTDHGTLRTPYGDWVLTGSSGFDATLDYTLSGTVPKGLVAAPQAASMLGAGVLTDANGNLLVDLKIGGSAKQPRVGLDTGAMRDRLAGRASQALEEQKTKVENQLREAAQRRQQQAIDSLRNEASRRLERAAKDSLGRKATDIFKGFFGKSAKTDTAHTP